jgi:hypothetical protein
MQPTINAFPMALVIPQNPRLQGERMGQMPVV